MSGALFGLTVLPVAAVIAVLCIGLWNMKRGTNANLSQKLMRWRVGLQFVAVIVLMASLFYKTM